MLRARSCQTHTSSDLQDLPCKQLSHSLVYNPLAVGNLHTARDNVKEGRHAVELLEEFLPLENDLLKHVGEECSLVRLAQASQAATSQGALGVCANNGSCRNVLTGLDDVVDGVRHSTAVVRVGNLSMRALRQRLRQPTANSCISVLGNDGTLTN